MNDAREAVRRRARVWRGVAAAAVAVMLMVAVTVAVVAAARREPAPPTAAPQVSAGNGIQLKEILNSTFSPESFNGTWISDTEMTFRDEDGALLLFDVTTLKATTLVDAAVMAEWRPFKYSLSPSRKYLLLVHDVQKLFRYSYLARHTILNLKTLAVTPLAPQRVKERQDQPPLLFATWAPSTDALAFVFHNDVYYTTGPSLSTMYRVSSTGKIGTIFNGVPDWVYEEEILSSNSAMWFSPKGGALVFATFNDSLVDTMNFPLYGQPGELPFQYPFQQSIKYPKPGRNNPVVDLWSVDLGALVSGKGNTVARLAPPARLREQDHYFSAVGWASEEAVSVIWMNRHQNLSIISRCSATGSCRDDLVHVSPDGAWNDMYVPPMYDSSGEDYLIVLPAKQGASGYYKHIHLRSTGSRQLEPLTSGTYEVAKILAWDEKKHTVYFTGAPSGNPGHRHLYYVGDLRSDQPKQAYCITCDFKNDYSEECNYNAGDMSPHGAHYALSCQGPGIPQVTLHRAADHSRLLLLQDNQPIREQLHSRSLPLEKRLEIGVKDGFKAQVSMKLPPDFDAGSGKKYPMLVYVYGGPGSQLVNDRFRLDWGDYLASQRGIIYTSIDGRGSGYGGDAILHALYRGLGHAEVDDQISVTAALQKSFPAIDASRTAIWGWSYGGYVTAAALAKDTKGVFSCGVSVAPVTSWIYYDSVYTERYMGLPTPDDNLAAYEASDVTRMADNFRGKKFFLIHGTADDNVHYQQSMMLARVLEKADILFSSQSYPDENHGLAGVRKHHYHSMENFLDRCYNRA